VPDLQESIHSSGVDDSETMESVANWREIAIALIDYRKIQQSTFYELGIKLFSPALHLRQQG
jgi:hypothetical protein